MRKTVLAVAVAAALGLAAVIAVPLLTIVALMGAASNAHASANCMDLASPAQPGAAAAPTPDYARAHARTIIGVGRTLRVPHKGVVVALAVALQESRLKNYANRVYPDSVARAVPRDAVGADHDSVGLFQQRPQAGWGAWFEAMDPQYAAAAFYGGPRVNRPAKAGLLDIVGWEIMRETAAGQAVQRSKYPDAYADDVPHAKQLLADNLDAPPVSAPNISSPGAGSTSPGTGGTSGTGGASTSATAAPAELDPCVGGVLGPGSGDAAGVVEAATAKVGLPYAWGGGNWHGPTLGICCSPAGTDASSIVGFDCSGLVMYAYYQATGVKFVHSSREQYAATAKSTVAVGDPDISKLAPGDLMFWGQPVHHVAIYAGNGLMVEAPGSGRHVHVTPVRDGDFLAATRPLASQSTSVSPGRRPSAAATGGEEQAP